MEVNEVTNGLESNNIDDVISTLDIMANEMLHFVSQSLVALEKNNEWRPFIVERIHNLFYKSKCAMEQARQKYGENDSDLRFWLSSLLVTFERNEDYILDIFNHVASNEDDKDLLGINILANKRTVNIGEVILEKLRRVAFTAENFDRIYFYLDNLKSLNVAIPYDIMEKVNFYNDQVQHAWRKLDF